MENNTVDFKKEKTPLIIPNVGLIIDFIETNIDKIREVANQIHIDRREIPCNWFNYNVDLRYNARTCGFILMASFQSARENKTDTRFFVENSMEIHGVTGESVEQVIELLDKKYLQDANNDEQKEESKEAIND